MKRLITISGIIGLLISGIPSIGQIDSTTELLQKIPSTYITVVGSKINQYSDGVNKKTIKTLNRLIKWEEKIKHTLQKINPDVAKRLFSNKERTFSGLLQKIQEGKKIGNNFQKKYDEYSDRLRNNINYLQQNEQRLNPQYVKKIRDIRQKIELLDSTEQNSAAIEQFIKERKKKLIEETFKIIGKNKYLKKINKDVYYYSSSIKNYKETFSDPQKVEQEALKILSKIPAFTNFLNQINAGMSPLACVGSNLSLLSSGSPASLNGLMSRSDVQQSINEIAGGSNITAVAEKLKESFQTYQQFKNKSEAIPDTKDSLGFKVNSQKSKSFKERLTYLFNFQFGTANNFYPSTCNIGFTLGYRINTKSSAGLGLSYILGMGNGWKNIKLTSEGIGARFFYEYKTGKNFYLRAGAELNYSTPFESINTLYQLDKWQRSALLGISKKVPLKGKIKGNIQIMYDFLHKSHLPISQPFVYRIGYSF